MESRGPLFFFGGQKTWTFPVASFWKSTWQFWWWPFWRRSLLSWRWGPSCSKPTEFLTCMVLQETHGEFLSSVKTTKKDIEYSWVVLKTLFWRWGVLGFRSYDFKHVEAWCRYLVISMWHESSKQIGPSFLVQEKSQQHLPTSLLQRWGLVLCIPPHPPKKKPDTYFVATKQTSPILQPGAWLIFQQDLVLKSLNPNRCWKMCVAPTTCLGWLEILPPEHPRKRMASLSLAEFVWKHVENS